MKIKIICCLTILKICSIPVFGQVNLDVNKIFAPAPDANAFAEYAKIPVDLSTGLGAINLPLMELKGKDMNIPISISYHSKGNKVNEISSNIGLGWVLNSGGVITRVVRGVHDDDIEGYIGKNRRGVKVTENSFYSLERDEQLSYASGAWDAEPDIFYFNFLGNTGRFVFGANGDIIMTPEQDFIINPPFGPNSTNDYWSIIDKRGTTYKFDSKEYSKSEVIFGISKEDSGRYISSWYLSSITSEKGDAINFEYQEGSEIETKSVLEKYSLTNCGTGVGFVETTTKTLKTQTISSITSRFGKVNILSLPDRLDISGARRITEISLVDNNTKLIKKIKFNQGYFSSMEGCDNQECKRLRLDNVVQESPFVSPDEYLKKYSFEYNSTKLPRRDSPQIDHWGFYNENNQSNLISRLEPANINAIREPKEIGTKANVLEKIIYDTGGSLSFQYELNEYKYSSSVNRNSGGLRIASVKEENIKSNKITNYKYIKEGTSISSGSQYRNPVYISNLSFWWDFGGHSTVVPQYVNCVGTTIYSVSQNNLFDLNGSNVMYNEVIVENPDGSTEINKYTDFNSNPDIYDSNDYFNCSIFSRGSNVRESNTSSIEPLGSPFGPPSFHKTFQRGYLVEKIFKDNSGNSLYQLNNIYTEKSPIDFKQSVGYKFDELWVYHVYQIDLINPGDLNGNGFIDFDERPQETASFIQTIRNYNISRYYENNGVYQLKKTIEKEGLVEKTTTYSYSDSKPTLIKEKSLELSNGSSKKEVFTYPFELLGALNTILADENRIQNPIEKREFLNNEQLYLEERVFKHYDLYNTGKSNRIPLLEKLNLKKKESEEYTSMVIDKYDRYGNVLQYHSNDNVFTSIIWGYKDCYPHCQNSERNLCRSFKLCKQPPNKIKCR